MENKTARPFGMKDKIGYAMGDFGNNFTFVFASMYLLTFGTDVLGIPSAVIGIVLAASKIVDAFTDFGMGRICDTAKPTKDGRFRPWIKRMAIPMGLSSILIYQYWVSNFSYTARIVWLVMFYILWGSFFYTACAIPYGSMASVITNDPKERTQLSTWRTIGATMSGLVIGMIAPMLVFSRNEAGQQVVSPEKFTLTAIIFGICSAVFYLLCYAMTTERIQINPDKADDGQPKLTVGETLKNLLTCKPLLVIIVVALLCLVASLGTSALNTYLYKDYQKGSAWARGQSWGLYGFTASYKHTKKQEYLDTARKIAAFFIENIPADGLIPEDFRQPAEPWVQDDIAACAASCGLIELAGLVPEEEGRSYLDAAIRMLKAIDKESADWNPENDGITMRGTTAYHVRDKIHGWNKNYVYADYFFIEAVLKLKGQGIYIW